MCPDNENGNHLEEAFVKRDEKCLTSVNEEHAERDRSIEGLLSLHSLNRCSLPDVVYYRKVECEQKVQQILNSFVNIRCSLHCSIAAYKFIEKRGWGVGLNRCNNITEFCEKNVLLN